MRLIIYFLECFRIFLKSLSIILAHFNLYFTIRKRTTVWKATKTCQCIICQKSDLFEDNQAYLIPLNLPLVRVIQWKEVRGREKKGGVEMGCRRGNGERLDLDREREERKKRKEERGVEEMERNHEGKWGEGRGKETERTEKE